MMRVHQFHFIYVFSTCHPHPLRVASNQQGAVAAAKQRLELAVAKNANRSKSNDADLAQLNVNQQKVIRTINANWVTAMLDCRQRLGTLKASEASLAQVEINIEATKSKLAANDADVDAAVALEKTHAARLAAAARKVKPFLAPKDEAKESLTAATIAAKASPMDKAKRAGLNTATAVYNKAYAAWQEAKQATEKVALDKKATDSKAATAKHSSARLKTTLASDMAAQAIDQTAVKAARANRPHGGIHTVSLLQEAAAPLGQRCTGTTMRCRAQRLQIEVQHYSKLADEQASSGKAAVEASYSARLQLQNRRHEGAMKGLVSDLKLTGQMCIGNWS